MGAMSKSSEAYVALGPDALLKRLAATAIELQEIKMDNPFPRDPMLGSMSIMEFGDPNVRTPDWFGKGEASAKAEYRACMAALVQIGPSELAGHPKTNG